MTKLQSIRARNRVAVRKYYRKNRRKAIRCVRARQKKTELKIKAWRKKNRPKELLRRRKWCQKNPDKVRAGKIKFLYDILPAERLHLLEAQHNQCGICAKTFTATPHIDHDHKTNKVRGLLCGNCNRGIGLLQDDPKLLQAAIIYLGKIQILKVAA